MNVKETIEKEQPLNLADLWKLVSMEQLVTSKDSTTEKSAMTEHATLDAKSKHTKQMNVLEVGCTHVVVK
jgi:hypothetical protein